MNGPIYISNEHFEQAARVKRHLLQYRSEFIDLEHINGAGIKVESAYNIWINLCLIISKVRPTFMIQWIDYLDSDIFNKIMSFLIKFRDETAQQDLDYRLLFLNDPQGIIITTYYTFYKNKLYEIYSQYLNSDRDDFYLGKILGYPAAGEIKLRPGDEEYLYRKEQPPDRYIFSIYIITYGSGYCQILSNIYRSSNARVALYDLYHKIVNTLKIYDADSLVLMEDSQGSLLSANQTLPSIENTKPIITEEQQEKHNKFIEDSERMLNNWNTEFDRIFELGFLYN